MQDSEFTGPKENQVTELIISAEEARLSEHLHEDVDLEVIPITDLSEVQKYIVKGKHITLVDVDGVMTSGLKVLPILCYLFRNPLYERSIQQLTDLEQISPTAVVTNRYEGFLPNTTYRSNRLIRKLANQIHESNISIPIFQKLDRYFPRFGRQSSYSNLFGFLEDNIQEDQEEITISFVYDLHLSLEIAKSIPLAGPFFQYVFTEGRFLRLTTDYIRVRRPNAKIKINAFAVSKLPNSSI